MKVSEVTKEDCRHIAQLIRMLQVSEYTANGKDICAAADSLRWIQNFAVDVAKSFGSPSDISSTPPPAEKPEEATDSPGLPSGVKVKSFNPGKTSKK